MLMIFFFFLFSGMCLSIVFKIIGTAVVLAVSLTLGTLSLMGLSQGAREQRSYQALDRASVTGLPEDVRAPAGLEDHEQQQQQQHTENLLDDSINSGKTFCNSLFTHVYLFVSIVFVCFHF